MSSNEGSEWKKKQRDIKVYTNTNGRVFADSSTTDRKLQPPSYLGFVQSLRKLSLLCGCERRAKVKASRRLVGSYLSGQVFEVVRVADATQLAVWLPIGVQALHDELGHLSGTRTQGGCLNKFWQSPTRNLISNCSFLLFVVLFYL